jgi:hypothetical protein
MAESFVSSLIEAVMAIELRQQMRRRKLENCAGFT